jgi:hypothetical protein
MGILLGACQKKDDPVPSTSTLPTTNTGRAASATAAALTSLGSMSAVATSTLAPRPAFGAPARVPAGFTYNASDTTYSFTAPSGMTVKVSFEKSDGENLALWTENGVSTETIDAGLLSSLSRLRFAVNGVDNGQTVGAVFNDSSFTSVDINASGFTSDLSLNGNITVAGPTGNFTFNSSSLTLAGPGANEGKISGPLTGAAGQCRLPDGTTVSVTLTLTHGAAVGTAVVGSETINLTVDTNGVGTYTDATGTHPIL